MCGRFALKTDPKKLAKQFQASLEEKYEPHYNIAPATRIPIIRFDQEIKGRVLKQDYWGLVPYWSKNPNIAAHTSNARAESVAEKPSYKRAFKNRRCLIPADGFYEWDRSTKPSQPYFFQLKNSRPFAFAGLWETWKVRWVNEYTLSKDTRSQGKVSKLSRPVSFPIQLGGKTYNEGDVLESCSIITTEANSLMSKVHDRMPVILDPQNYDAWLDPIIEDTGILSSLLKPFPADQMLCWPVERAVNAVTNDSPECIREIKVSKSKPD